MINRLTNRPLKVENGFQKKMVYYSKWAINTYTYMNWLLITNIELEYSERDTRT
jgi:hypothetical protein